MLALARGLATDPAILLLDELSMGLAPLVVSNLYELVAQVAREGVAVLVVEQFASAVLGISDHAAVMVNGRIALAGPPGDGFVEQLSALYLGGGAPETRKAVRPKKAPVKAPVAPIRAPAPAGNGTAPVPSGPPPRPVAPKAARPGPPVPRVHPPRQVRPSADDPRFRP
jgi:energy-coupling factor transporter ATP-binding protein EcfA2